MKFVDGAEFGDRSAERIEHGGQGQSRVRVNCQVAKESTV